MTTAIIVIALLVIVGIPVWRVLAFLSAIERELRAYERMRVLPMEDLK